MRLSEFNTRGKLYYKPAVDVWNNTFTGNINFIVAWCDKKTYRSYNASAEIKKNSINKDI